eukprot:scaffold742_cov186-Ochromonas_danica.AAC.10
MVNKRELLPTDRAYVGFTASTGRFYEKHDLLSWEWCDQPPCSLPSIKILDYHQGSKKTLAEVQDYEPGVGYGGGDADTFPTKNESPDTTPWEMEITSSTKYLVLRREREKDGGGGGGGGGGAGGGEDIA